MQPNQYQLLDSGEFFKLEQAGPFRLVRPAPQAVWDRKLPKGEWQKVDAHFERHFGGDGYWHKKNKSLPGDWLIFIDSLSFEIRLTNFGHLGIFPEQKENWQVVHDLIKQNGGEDFELLNLFAYTGGASIAAAKAGAKIVHVDASKTSVLWAKKNCQLNGLAAAKIRWLVEDVQKFVKREINRKSQYHGIILDPPSFGRGPKNEVWKIEDHLFKLIEMLKKLLHKEFTFILLSSHTPGYTPLALKNLMASVFSDYKGQYRSVEMTIEEPHTKRHLPSGASCLFIRS